MPIELWDDLDVALPGLLAECVPTGVLEAIEPSGVWRATDIEELDLHIWEEPGLDNPDLLTDLVQADVDEGFAEWVDGGLGAIKDRFGSLVAACKLGIVQKAGATARLIGDSSVSGANAQCRIKERIELPTLSTVAQFLSRHPQSSG